MKHKTIHTIISIFLITTVVASPLLSPLFTALAQENQPENVDGSEPLQDEPSQELEELPEEPNSVPGKLIHNIEVCFITLDHTGNIIQSLPQNTIMQLDVYDEGAEPQEDQVNNYGVNPRTITYSSQQLNRDLLHNDGIHDGYCTTEQYIDPLDVNYTYSQISLLSPFNWAQTEYNDQFNTTVAELTDFFEYSNEFFDEIIGNEDQRDINADGHIVMNNGDRVYRHLIIKNQLLDDLSAGIIAPEITINIEDGLEYVGNSMVDPHLSFTAGVRSDTTEIRFAESDELIETVNWFSFEEFNNEILLPNAFEDGNKQLCVQVKNEAGTSNIACDSIILDTIAPSGSVIINNDNAQTSSTQLTLTLSANDPKISDALAGSGIKEMRFAKDNGEWSEWEQYAETKEFVVETTNADVTVNVQYKDAVGNISQVFSDSITINSLTGSGDIIINNDELFTDNVDVTLQISAQNVKNMRFIQTNGTNIPNTPPPVYEPNDNLGGWTYWYEYSPINGTHEIQWDLSQPLAGNANDAFGQKNVYVQFMYNNNEISPLYHDSIIYAPYYGIEYYSVTEPTNEDRAPEEGSDYEINIPAYTLSNMPDTVLSHDQFKLKFKAKNTGSLTWLYEAYDEETRTVNLTHFWEVVDIDPLFEEFVQYEQRGNNAEYPSPIQYNEETGEVTLLIETPGYPGTYSLRLDALHENTARFSEFNNPSPTFELNIEQNPDSPPPLVYVEVPLPDNAGYYPYNPQQGQHHVITGWVHHAGYNKWGAPYIMYEDDGSGAYWYIKQHDMWQYVGQRISIPIELTKTGSYEFNLIGWDSQVISAPNTIHMRPGNAVEVEVRYRNDGYHFWNPGATRLGTQQPQDRGSQFYDGNTWISGARIPMKNTNNVRFGDVARFRFNLNAPKNISDGTYRECFRPLVEGVSWAGGSIRDVCINIIIDSDPSNPIPPPDFSLPPEPVGDTGYVIRYNGVELLTGPHPGFPILDNLDYEEEVKILGETHFEGRHSWLKVRTLDGQEGWVPKHTIDHVIDPEDISFNIGLLFDNAYVCASLATARSGPGTNYTTLEILNYGYTSKILANHAGWNLITLPNGRTGWVNEGLCDGFPPQYNNNTSNNSTNNTGTGGNILGSTLFNNQIFSRPLNDGSYSISQGYRDGHKATDYAAACGTPVFATADGYVHWVVSGFSGGYYEHPPTPPVFRFGMNLNEYYSDVLTYKQRKVAWEQTRDYWYQRANFVVINHDNNSQSLYVHLKDVYVTSGQEVRRGQKIGTVGNTGWSSGCHLHLEIRADQNNPYNTKINPEQIYQQGINEHALAAEIAMRSREEHAQYRTVNNNSKFVHEYCGAWIKDYEYFVDPGQSWRTYTNLIYNPATEQAHRLRGDIRIVYWNNYSGTCGRLGIPTSDDLWAATSPTGTRGAYQTFDGGVIHSSVKGTFASWGSIHQQHSARGGTLTYGFPTSEIYSTNERGMCQDFEEEVLCEKAPIDNRSDAEKAIDARASKLQSNGASALTQICGYPAKVYSQVIAGEDGVIVYVNGRAIYSYGGTYDTFNYYSDKCNRFGIFTSDPQVADKGKFNTPGAYQDLKNGRIYWSWKHAGKFMYGTIWQKYEAAYGTKSNYGWPTSEVYTYTMYPDTPDEFTSQCQDFEGSEPYNRICEDTIPQKTAAQRALEARVGREVAPNEIRIACGGRSFVNISNGVAYYDPHWDNSRLITNPLYNTWNNNGNCATYGLPENDTDSVWSVTGKTGHAQRFNKDIHTFDFYNSEFGLLILEGTSRNLYEAAGGLGNTGFPKNIYTDVSKANRGVCVETERDTLCERETPDWYLAIETRLGEINHSFDENLIQETICTDVNYKTYPLTNPTGVMYYDSIYNNVRIIRGNIYAQWNTDGRCAMYGLPESDTDLHATSYTNIKGEFQRFYRDNLIFDLYSSEFGTFALEGTARNLYQVANGLGSTGFPTNVYTDNYRGICVDTEGGLLCEKEEVDDTEEPDEPVEPECADGEVWDCEGCVDAKEYECQHKNMSKFLDSEGVTFCARWINVPYFNQYRDQGASMNSWEDGSPENGWRMCGAASVTMVGAYFNKIPIEGQSKRVKDYMHKNEGTGLTQGRNIQDVMNSRSFIDNYSTFSSTLCHDGAFGVTGMLANCLESSKGGIETYLEYYGLETNVLWHNAFDFEPTRKFIKNAIDRGNPVIITYGQGELAHITVIKGYTDTGEYIMNDSYRNTSLRPHGNGDLKYYEDGNNATYSLDTDSWIPGYLLEVY